MRLSSGRLFSTVSLSIDWLCLIVANQLDTTDRFLPFFFRSSLWFCGFFPRSLFEPHRVGRKGEKKLFTNSAPGRTDTTWMVSMSNGTVSFYAICTRNCNKIVTLDIRRSHFRAHIGVKLTCESSNFRTLHNFFLSSFVQKKSHFGRVEKDFYRVVLRTFCDAFTWISIRLWWSSC